MASLWIYGAKEDFRDEDLFPIFQFHFGTLVMLSVADFSCEKRPPPPFKWSGVHELRTARNDCGLYGETDVYAYRQMNVSACMGDHLI